MLSWSWKKILHQWLKRRIPRQSSHRLQHRNIFILPSKTGLAFAMLILLMWLLGTNYQNNLVLATAFLLLAMMVVCIHHTYASLSGLQLQVVKTHPGFVGSEGTVDLLVKRLNQRPYESLDFNWSQSDEDGIRLSLIDQDQVMISLSVPLQYRGWYEPERLKISTSFPLGLIVAWSYLDFDAPILAYPAPIETNTKPELIALDDNDDENDQALSIGHEEFAGLREYHHGDSLRNIDWRTMAKGQGLATRIYHDYVTQEYWLDWQQFDGLGREERLSRLCACVLEQSKAAKNNSGLVYGLRLPNTVIQPGAGDQHREAVLQALALFEWEHAKDSRK